MAIHHAISGEAVDLRPLGEALKDATTKALVKSETFEAVRLIVKAGKKMPNTRCPVRLRCTASKAKYELVCPTAH